MKAELKRLHSPDVDDLTTHVPKTNDSFGFLLQVMVGTKGKEGEESFDIFVCTPRWLIKHHKENEILFGRHYMIVFKYDYDLIIKKLKSYIEKLEGDNWDELAQKINLIGKWEFEDYRE
jgi:hypothetical protein